MWELSSACSCVLYIVYFVGKYTTKYLLMLFLRISLLVMVGMQPSSVSILGCGALCIGK
jgi:hypothetical protein